MGATTLNGSSTDYKLNWTFSLVSKTITPTPLQKGTRTTRPTTSTWWSLTQKVRVGVSVMFIIRWESSFTSGGGNTIKILLMAHKAKDNITSKGGAIYQYRCDHLGCIMEYIGETGSSFGNRYKKHTRSPSTIHEYPSTMGHPIKLDNFSTMDRKYRASPGP